MALKSITIYRKIFFVEPYGNEALRFVVDNEEQSLLVSCIAEAIKNSNSVFIEDIIASRKEFLIVSSNQSALLNALKDIADKQLESSKSVNYRFPILLDPEPGIENSISKEQLTKGLDNATLKLSMYGFIPGFLYFSGLDPSLHLPRKETPKTNCQAGSVAIGGRYLGVYNFSSPAGWHIVGRTPVHIPIADIHALHIADEVNIEFIDEDRFNEIKAQNLDLIEYNAQA